MKILILPISASEKPDVWSIHQIWHYHIIQVHYVDQPKEAKFYLPHLCSVARTDPGGHGSTWTAVERVVSVITSGMCPAPIRLATIKMNSAVVASLSATRRMLVKLLALASFKLTDLGHIHRRTSSSICSYKEVIQWCRKIQSKPSFPPLEIVYLR